MGVNRGRGGGGGGTGPRDPSPPSCLAPQNRVGAVQGFSKAVDYDEVHERVDPEKVPDLIHGTHYDFYKKIFKEGLLPGAGNRDYRDQVHLLEATNIGSRLLSPKCDIILHIDPALATGCRFYKSANGYYLTGEPIGPQAISAVTIKETKERVEAEKKGSPPLPSIVLQVLLRSKLGGRRPTANAQSSESSHRRAYMVHWQLVRFSQSCVASFPTLRLQPLMQETKQLRQQRPRPPKGGAAGEARCTTAGPPQQTMAPARVHAPWQDLGTSGNFPQGGLRSAQGPSCWTGRVLVLVSLGTPNDLCVGGAILSLDLKQAFDRVNRQALVQALRRLKAPEELIAAVIALHDTSAYHIHDAFSENKSRHRKGNSPRM